MTLNFVEWYVVFWLSHIRVRLALALQTKHAKLAFLAKTFEVTSRIRLRLGLWFRIRNWIGSRTFWTVRTLLSRWAVRCGRTFTTDEGYNERSQKP
jgi:hypothetical protein